MAKGDRAAVHPGAEGGDYAAMAGGAAEPLDNPPMGPFGYSMVSSEDGALLDVEGFETYRHSGFWGTVATYVSELDLVVAATVNQNQGGVTLYQITERSIALVAEASRSTKS